MKAFYSDHFVLPLPDGHRFPMSKYRKLRERVASDLAGINLSEPSAATDGQLALAHAPDYIDRVSRGLLSPAESRAIGFPWSEAMVERSRRSVGATISACRTALVEGIAVSLAGGTHHAQHERGAGYCVFNDAAVAARQLQADSAASRRQMPVAIIDLDVHQGDGTAQILAGDSTAFTLSLHGATNFPFRKQTSCLDIGLPDGTGDVDYLAQLDAALDELQRRFAPQFILYLSGADTHEDDRLGKLKLSLNGIGRRDQRIFEFAERLRVPIAVTMGGGYGRDIDTTVAIHLQTVRLAFQSWQRTHAAPRDECGVRSA